jgi:hypothetical protein
MQTTTEIVDGVGTRTVASMVSLGKRPRHHVIRRARKHEYFARTFTDELFGPA